MAQRTIFDFVTPATVPMQLVFPPVTATFETARERRNRSARERRARNRAQQQVDLRSAPTYGQVPELLSSCVYSRLQKIILG